MGEYRYHVGMALRLRGTPPGCFDGTELRSEDFDTDEEFCQAIASHVLELIKDQEEKEEEDAADES